MEIKKILSLIFLMISIFNLFGAQENKLYLNSSGYWDGGKLLEIIDCNSNNIIRTIKLDFYDIDYLSISNHSKTVIVVPGHYAYLKGYSSVQIINIDTGELLKTINIVTRDRKGCLSPISNILISHDNKKLIVNLGKLIQIIDIHSGAFLKAIKLKSYYGIGDGWCSRILISNDDKKLIIDLGQSVKIIDIDSKELLKNIELNFNFNSESNVYIGGLLISHDGKKLIIYSHFCVKIIRLDSDEFLETRLERYSPNNLIYTDRKYDGVFTYSICNIIISDDDKKLIVNLGDSVEIIDIDSGKLLKRLECKEKDNAYSSSYDIYNLSIVNNKLQMDTQILPVQEFDLSELDF